MTLKEGDLIVIENTRNLKKPINQFYKKWETAIATAMVTTMATEMGLWSDTRTATEKQTGKQIKIKYHGTGWKPFENNRLIGIVTEITKEDHRDFDVIKIREQTGGIRCCRRYILENV